MQAVDRAKRAGDEKYLLVVQTYSELKNEAITQQEAVSRLGKGYESTVLMWLRGTL